MGTAGYMSPEQVRGEKLDARTDIFSFGLVLYQMVTGQRAFPGKTTAIVHDAILNNAPVPVRELNSTLPAKLVAVIDKCLEKQRERRQKSAGDVRTALEEVRRVAAPRDASSLRRKRIAVASVIAVLVAACAAVLWWSRRPMAQYAFKNYKMTALTSTSNVAFADTSPDGRYLAYVDDVGGEQSLWVEQLATSTPVRILGPVSLNLGRGLRFSPDSNYLYYLQGASNRAQSLYRVAVLGGPPERILNDAFSSIDFSPDGKRIVYLRHTGIENYLLTANADGTGEKRLLTLPAKELMRLPAWAPDGRTIAFGIDEAGMGSSNCIAAISSQGGRERRFLRSVAGIMGLTWLPDQSGLMITAVPASLEDPALWVVSYPDGGLRRVNNDLAGYYGVSFAHNARDLVTVKKQMDSSLWVAPALNPTEAVQLREGAGNKDGLVGVAWLADGRLVYANGGSKSELWLMDRDGGHRQQLTHTGNHGVVNPAAGPEGTFVFAKGWPGLNIWMIESEGAPRQITSGPTPKWMPEISPDGKWVTYIDIEAPWKMSLSGGEPVKLAATGGQYPTISPDGHWIAFQVWDMKERNSKIEIVASDGKVSPHFLPFPLEPQVPESTNMGTLPIRWTSDGKGLTYVRTKNGVSNLWSQPIDGSAAKQLTNFTSMYIWRHAWSPDGKYLVMARGNFSRDAVMLTDLH